MQAGPDAGHCQRRYILHISLSQGSWLYNAKVCLFYSWLLGLGLRDNAASAVLQDLFIL